MRAPERPDALLISLDKLAALATAADSEILAALRARLRAAGCGCWWSARPSGARARWWCSDPRPGR
jgi:hypothetical protein